jgi:oxygen-independent coproporphyrinogen-3 oxidase
MKLTLHGHDDRYAVEQLQLSLFPDGTEGEAVSSLHRGKVWLTAVTKITVNGVTATATRRIKAADETVRLRRRALQQSYYLAAKQLLPVTPPWGALAGVRPTKITTKHLLEGGSPKSADKLLRDVYYVTGDRRRLAVDCSVSTVRAVNMLQPKDLSLYVGIPFCPTRCTYCSFVSRTIGKKTELLEPYLRALEQEIAVTGRLLAQSGRTVRTLYIGGGTPTTLSAPQMERLMSVIRDNFDLSRCIEFTVEGGRPDTLDLEKLQVIRSGGADRRSGGVRGGGVERAAVLRHMKKAHPQVRFLRMVTFSPVQNSR